VRPANNIEGYNYDDTQTAVSLLLADQFGNPVADNTPVVFQTDSGAIGSASRGGCNTQNGGCAVTFRSQILVITVMPPLHKKRGAGNYCRLFSQCQYSVDWPDGNFSQW
jgi:hypothetical protein